MIPVIFRLHSAPRSWVSKLLGTHKNLPHNSNQSRNTIFFRRSKILQKMTWCYGSVPLGQKWNFSLVRSPLTTVLPRRNREQMPHFFWSYHGTKRNSLFRCALPKEQINRILKKRMVQSRILLLWNVIGWQQSVFLSCFNVAHTPNQEVGYYPHVAFPFLGTIKQSWCARTRPPKRQNLFQMENLQLDFLHQIFLVRFSLPLLWISSVGMKSVITNTTHRLRWRLNLSMDHSVIEFNLQLDAQ